MVKKINLLIYYDGSAGFFTEKETEELKEDWTEEECNKILIIGIDISKSTTRISISESVMKYFDLWVGSGEM